MRNLCDRLALWAEILLFEVNFAYGVWYGRKPRLGLTPDQREDVARQLAAAVGEQHLTNRDKALYLSRLGLGPSLIERMKS